MKEFFEFCKMFPDVSFEVKYDKRAESYEVTARRLWAGELFQSKMKFTLELSRFSTFGDAIYHHILTHTYNKLPK